VYFIFSPRNNCGKEASQFLLLLYNIPYGFGHERNDSRLYSCRFCFRNKAQIESRSLAAPASTISDTHGALDPPVVQFVMPALCLLKNCIIQEPVLQFLKILRICSLMSYSKDLVNSFAVTELDVRRSVVICLLVVRGRLQGLICRQRVELGNGWRNLKLRSNLSARKFNTLLLG
jgi:hypothetical protein